MDTATARIAISPEEDRAIWQRVKEEQYGLIFFHTNRHSSAVAFAMAMVLWVYVFLQLGNVNALAWGAAIHVMQLIRSAWVKRYYANPAAAIADADWERGYILRLGLSGLLWGAAPLLMFEPGDLTATILVTVTVLAIHSGGQTWVAPVRNALLAFCVPIVALLCVALALHESTAMRVAAVLAFIYLFQSNRFALQHNEMLTKALHERLVNVALNRRLSEQIGVVEKASADKSRFLAAASHDLRQPMHAIALFSGALEHNLRGTPHHDSASRSLGAVRALSQSLDAMLDVSKLDAGIVVAKQEHVPLQQVFQQLHSVFSPDAAERQLQLRFRSTSLRVLTDRAHLERMLANLVSNALKYTPQGGVLVAARRRSGGIAIEVWDTGFGIPEDQLDKIFEEFYQLRNPGRDRALGLGIGLAVVKRLTNLLGLGLEVRSRVDRGSVFRVLVPASQLLEDADPMPGDVTPGIFLSQTARLPSWVVVLDDEEDIQAAVGSVLSSYKVRVLQASTCEQALEHLRVAVDSGGTGALVCDLRLGGGVSGLDFARTLASQHGLVVPTVMVTGETGPDALQQMRQSGLQAVFKPVSAQGLLDALVAACERPLSGRS
jgi:signal transduction histidine kinase/CheY-like chemotaxis protein